MRPGTPRAERVLLSERSRMSYTSVDFRQQFCNANFGNGCMNDSFASRLLRSAGQPLLLLTAIGLWMVLGGGTEAVSITLIAILALLFVLERWQTRRRDWRQSPREKAALVVAWIVLGLMLGLITVGYERLLYTLPLPQQLGTIWPDALPWPAQALSLIHI